MNLVFRSLFIVLTTVSLSIAQRYELVWSDEFDGNALDLSKWSYMYGTGSEFGLNGWGNNELQYYTDRSENIIVSEGTLKIIAQKERYSNRDYTSARIRSINKGDWKYGIFKIRAKLPIGQGMWPAIWMMPTDSEYGGWPKSGEIDIMESRGGEPEKVGATIHFGNNWPSNSSNGGSYEKSGTAFADEFHEYELQWTKGLIRFFVDGYLFYSTSNWFTPNGSFPAPFDKRFHMILNLAVGGNYGGNPDNTTVFPGQLEIDYVRVYQNVNEIPVVSTSKLGETLNIESGKPLDINASVIDNDGTVTEVTWYINDIKFKEEEINKSGNYSLNWPIVIDGCHDVYLVVRDNDTGEDSVFVNRVTTNDICGEMHSYFDEPIAIPGTIEAVHFNKGGNGLAYFDKTPLVNSGGSEVFRFDEAVDTRLFAENTYVVSEAEIGEWLTYFVTVQETAPYEISATINKITSDTRLVLFVDDKLAAQFTRFPSNNEGGTSTKIVGPIELTAGEHVLKVQVELGETELLSFNFKNLNNTSTEEFAITRKIHVDLYPNPFNPSSNLSVNLPVASRTEINIYDVNGRLISTLYSGVLSIGEHTFQIQAQNWPSGIYIYSVKTQSEVITGKMVLIK